MAIDKIKEMVDSYPDKIEGTQNQINAVDKQIAEFQEQQDALQQILEQLYEEVVNDFLVTSCDFLYRGPQFYSGTGIGDIDSTLVNWEGYFLVSDPIIGTDYFDVSVNPPESKTYDETFDPYYVNYVDDTSIQDKYDEFLETIDYIHHPIGTTGMYGTKGNIANLQNAKSALESNKQKFIDSQEKLKRFGE